MNKQLSPDEIANLSMPTIVAPMTRRAKLMHLAHVARTSTTRLGLYHQLERCSDEMYNEMSTRGSVFALGKDDPVLREAGYTGETVGDAKRFFELSREDLHEFSCDCGGDITNEDMADRIEKIAGSVPPTQIVIDSKSWTG
jgi:hypothetical protein